MANFPDTPVSLLVRLASDRTGIRDEAGWTRLFELYAPAIRAFAEERGSEDESEDVVQEIFMRLVEVLRDGRVKVGGDAGKFRRYLATLVRNELVSRWRKRMARGEGASVSLDDPGSGVEASVDSDAARGAGRRLNGRLRRRRFRRSRRRCIAHTSWRIGLSAKSPPNSTSRATPSRRSRPALSA